MFEDMNNRITNAIHFAFIDNKCTNCFDERYAPKLLLNDAEHGQKHLSVIEHELQQCREFSFNVTFISMSGLVGLLQTLHKLKEKGIRGKIFNYRLPIFTIS